MTNPIPPDQRPYGAHFRTSEVMKVPIQFLLSYPAGHPNPHDALTEDILCEVCSTRGNVKNVDPLNLGDGTLDQTPETGRSYIWDFPTLRRNHRCSMCRLVWRTFQPFYTKLEGSGPPSAVLGYNEGGKDGEPRWIELLPMVLRNTMDNRDIMNSGQVVREQAKHLLKARLTFTKYIYEDDRIPHFNIAQLATSETSGHGKQQGTPWRQARMLDNDRIDFTMVKKWIAICTTEHGSKCNGHEHREAPARRLIDVEKNCIVEGLTGSQYLALSYVWGMAAQFMLTKDIVDDAKSDGFFELLGSKVPRSIQDAMTVCRQINIRYLWVDALCIVQDSNEDRQNQIGLMDQIYGCALAVLVVAAGDGADSGIPGMSGKNRDLMSYVESVGGKQLMSSLASTTLSAKRSKWNTRAWTYQEYILGNRLLVFTDTYVFFKCSMSLLRDDAVPSISGALSPMPMQSDDRWIDYTLNDIGEEMDPKELWKDYYDSLLSVYLRRNMTLDTDALPAISGVLKVLSKSLGSFHFGLPQNHFGRSLLWGASHPGIFERRLDFPSWSWAGWKWTFDYFDADRSLVGVYGYDMPKEIIPIQFFTFGAGDKLELLFVEEPEAPPEEMGEATQRRLKVDDLMSQIMYWNSQLTSEPDLSSEELDAKCQRMIADMYIQHEAEKVEISSEDHDKLTSTLMSHFEPPDDYLELQHTDLIAHSKYPDRLIAFYTSVATLRVTLSETEVIKPYATAQYDVKGEDGRRLFECRIDPAWRQKQPDSLDFVVMGLKENRKQVAVMLLENVNGIHYRVNWEWRLSQHLSIEKWMGQSPVRKLIVLG